MLTIVTGTPGAGKSLFTLWKIKKEFRDDVDPSEQREIYVNGIPELDYEYFGADELVDPEKWYELPEGSIVVIDEAQRIFPQRPPSIPVPNKCRQFETHRHRGFDVFVTTQDATTLDVHLRKLAGRHFHIKRTLGQEVATVYEYDQYQKDPTDHFTKKESVSQAPWKYPKELYEKYKSATLHTVKKRYPLKLFIIPVALLCIFLLGKLAFNTLMEDKEVIEAAGDQVESDSGMPGGILEKMAAFDITAYISQFKPTVPGLEHSAPVYQKLFKARTFPKPYCIIYQKSHEGPIDEACMCKTQQGTAYDTADSNCRYWAHNGFFDPTRDERKGEQGRRPNAQAGPHASIDTDDDERLR